jgi:hypothetical protein
MRDYGTVASQFWVRGTGKELRGDMEAQIVALYLMTSPHANMIGVFHLPVMYLAHETGLETDAAKAALDRLTAKDFCTYEAESEWIFVHSFAANQIGEELKEGDKRIKGVLNEMSKVPDGSCLQAFVNRYTTPFHLGISPSEAPSKPLRSQNRTEQEQKQNQSPLPGAFPGFARFWDVWPKHERKESKGKCLDSWKKAKAEGIADTVIADVERRKLSSSWTKDAGQFIPAPLAYLNQRKWEGADVSVNDDPYGIKKAINYGG